MKIEAYKDIIPDFEEFRRIMATPQPYWMRVNTLKISEKDLIARLENKGFRFERYRDWNAYMIVESPVKHPGATFEHSLGYYYIQDFASMIPPIVLKPRKGERILDMAAAPGSKTTQIAAMVDDSATIVANDIRDDRIRALAGNVERVGATSVIITRGDARAKRFGMTFDRILLDAPCTGEGVVRKTPRKREPDLREHIKFSKMQMRMVENAYRHLKDGGVMVYSTCTYNPLENEHVVQYAVDEVGFVPLQIDIDIPYERGVREWRERSFEGIWDKVIRVYPHRINTGGMFIALLKK